MNEEKSLHPRVLRVLRVNNMADRRMSRSVALIMWESNSIIIARLYSIVAVPTDKSPELGELSSQKG